MDSKIKIQEAAFDIRAEQRQLKAVSRSVGAIAMFTGSVRDLNDDNDVGLLHLEHYPGMTENELAKILEDAEERWPLIAATVIHRVGDLHPGDDIVFVGTATEHRADAFSSCEFIMDYLKTKAAFWKKEKTTEGDRWLKTRESDLDAVRSWEKVGEENAD